MVAPELGRPHEQVSLRTSDGLELVGWYAPSRNRAAAIVFPGHDGPAPHARMLVRRGYGVLMLDRRGEGESQGDYNARGWGGEPDLEAAISYLAKRDDVDSQRIGGLGLSVGGELLIQTATRDGRLAAVVSEGAGNQSLADQMQTPDAPKAVRWLSPMTIETVAGIVLSERRPPVGLATAIRRIAPRPVLLITGGRGNPDEALNGVYRAAGGPTVSLWEISEAGHTGGLAAEPASTSVAWSTSSIRRCSGRRRAVRAAVSNCGFSAADRGTRPDSGTPLPIAAVNPETGQPVENGLRNLWVTSTALSTA